MEKDTDVEPLVAPEVDLRDFVFMPLDVVRLRDSDLGVVCSDAEIRAALWLWCASWHQVPAASLPDQDNVLASMAGFGRGKEALTRWLEVRQGALRGYVKCVDGRLYHPVIAEKANEAWAEKTKYRQRRDEFRKRQKDRANARWDGSAHSHGDDSARRSGGKTDVDAALAFDVNANAALPPWHDDVNANANMPMKGTVKGTVKGTGTKDISSSTASPLTEPAENPPTPEKPAKATTYPPEFLEGFWDIYPRRVNKLDALKSWKRAVTHAGGGKDAQDRIRKAAVAFSEASRGQDPKFIPHPATWLNKGAWEEAENFAPGQHRPGYIPMGVGG
jgi:hypothetical protein